MKSEWGLYPAFQSLVNPVQIDIEGRPKHEIFELVSQLLGQFDLAWREALTLDLVRLPQVERPQLVELKNIQLGILACDDDDRIVTGIPKDKK